MRQHLQDGSARFAGNTGFDQSLLAFEVLFAAAAFDDFVKLLTHDGIIGCRLRFEGGKSSTDQGRIKTNYGWFPAD